MEVEGSARNLPAPMVGRRGTNPCQPDPSPRGAIVRAGAEQVSWLPDRSTRRTFPGSRPTDGVSAIRAAQWLRILLNPAFVPGYSGGGRAGISPASLSRLPSHSTPITTLPVVHALRLVKPDPLGVIV